MGNKPSPSPLPSAASVVKSKEDNGFKLIQVNLDANADGNGISPWSIVAIIMATLLSVWILTRLRRCYQNHIRSKPTSRSIELGPLRYESAATNNHADAPDLEEEGGSSGTRRGGRNNKRIWIRRAPRPGPERKTHTIPVRHSVNHFRHQIRITQLFKFDPKIMFIQPFSMCQFRPLSDPKRRGEKREC